MSELFLGVNVIFTVGVYLKNKNLM